MKKRILKELVKTADVVIHDLNELCDVFEKKINQLQTENSALKKELENNSSAQAYALLKMEFEKFKIQSRIEYTDLEMNFRKISKQGSETHNNLANQVVELQKINNLNANHIDKLNKENFELKKALSLGDSKGTLEQANQISDLQKLIKSYEISEQVSIECFNTVQDEKKQLENKIDELEKEIDKLNACNIDEISSNLLKEINENKISVINFDKNGSFTIEFDNNFMQIECQNERLMRINKDIDKRNFELDLENREFLNQVCELGSKNKDLQSIISDLQSTIEQKDKVIEHLQSNNELNSLNDRLKQSDNKVLKLENQISFLKSEISELTKENKKLINFNQSLYSELTNYKDICEKLAKNGKYIKASKLDDEFQEKIAKKEKPVGHVDSEINNNLEIRVKNLGEVLNKSINIE